MNKDGSVTFRLEAPKAEKVVVKGLFISGETPLVKDADGIWKVTIKPAKADIYPYNFVVDGVQKSSLLEQPNPEALYTVNDVPHGNVHYRTYHSDVLSQYRTAVIYTPAEYEKNPNKKYPVFYLISGTTGTPRQSHLDACPLLPG